ncbi:DNA-binding transcriptional ArsR family regulator [Bradyrhizobium sp. GM0.4]
MAKDSVQLAALGDSTRRRIFALLGARPRTVVELTRELTVSQSAVSQHLKVLRESHLVRAEPKGAS